MSTATKTKGTNYTEAVGRRKTAIARLRVHKEGKTVVVNTKPIAAYFPTLALQRAALEPITKEGVVREVAITAVIKGGGVRAQAEAFRHALARILVKEDKEARPELKKAGFLKRDARKKERKHFGLKKARKASQWSKR